CSISMWKKRPRQAGDREPATTSAWSSAKIRKVSESTPASSTTTLYSGGSSVRITSTCGRNPRRRPEKRGTCQSSSISSWTSLCRRSRWSFFPGTILDRKSTRLNSSHEWISYAVFCLKKHILVYLRLSRQDALVGLQIERERLPGDVVR